MTTAYRSDQLAARLSDLLGSRHPVAAATTVTARGATVASVGAPVEADYEIGSISKGITGLLYVDAIGRGEVVPDRTLGDLLPLADVPAGRVTLASLSTHHSGLPRLPRSAAPVRRTLAMLWRGTNPYGESLEELFVQARGVRLGRARARYSNFGYELLGHALARAAATTYQDLVRQRLAEPLGLRACYVPATPEQLRPGALIGRTRRGRAQQPWTGEALGPAGGIRASIEDMARLATALLDGSAPGVAALDPVAKLTSRMRIGAAWVTTEPAGRMVTWHNGGTGGFRTWLGLDRSAGTGVAIMSATSVPVDREGLALLAELSKEP